MADQSENSAVAANTNETEQIEQAQEYRPGELAPSIITAAQVWKPDDLDKADPSIRQIITGLVNTCSVTDEAARRFSILQTWENRHIDRGYQYLLDDGHGGWSIAGVGSGSNRNNNVIAASDDANLYPTNIFSAQGDIVTSALCRGEIRVHFTPSDSKVPAEVAAADEGNKYRHLWSKVNNQMDLQRDVMGLGWTDCRVLAWTRTMADKNYGIGDDGAPKRAEITSIHGILESKGPMMADKLCQWSYAQIFEEVDYAVARAAYPWMGTKIKPSWGTFGELEFERIARINTRIGIVGKYITGTSGIRETTMGYIWFRPGMYFDDSIQVGQREFLLKNFPRGLFVIMGGAELCCCWDESMDDHLALGLYTRGFGQNRRSLGSSDVPIQKRINIWADLWDKFVRSAIPVTVLHSDVYDVDAIAKLEAAPSRFVPAQPPEGMEIAQTYGQTPSPVPVPGMQEIFQWYVGPLIQSIDGGTPALFGSGEGEDNTVGATQIRLQQSLERIGTAWVMANWLFATAVRQAALCCGENATGPFNANVPGHGEIEINPSRLRGRPDVTPETVNGIPESGAQREAKVLQVLDMAQVSAQAASLIATPSNAREIVRALHIDEVITIDEADSEDKQLEEVDLLLKGSPILNPKYAELEDQIAELNATHEQAKEQAAMAVQSGAIPDEGQISQGEQMEQQLQQLQQQLQQTHKYLPSVPVAEDASEDHATEAATLFAWMQRSDGRSLRRASYSAQEGSPEWNAWMNIYLHWEGHEEQKAKQAKAQAPLKVNVTGKLTPEQQAQILGLAGIQTQPDTGEPNEFEQETKQFSPVGEVTQRVKRRL